MNLTEIIKNESAISSTIEKKNERYGQLLQLGN